MYLREVLQEEEERGGLREASAFHEPLYEMHSSMLQPSDKCLSSLSTHFLGVQDNLLPFTTAFHIWGDETVN